MRLRHRLGKPLLVLGGLYGAPAFGHDGAAAPLPASAASASALGQGLERADQVMKLLAYVVGGTWVYFNYFRGRTYRPRLETRVTCELLRAAEPTLLRIVASAHNAGLSKVDLQDKGSGAQVHGYDLASGTWVVLQAHSMLTTQHQWIEPAETVLDEILVRIDAAYPAYRVELWLNSPSKITWAARTIVGQLAPPNPTAARAERSLATDC